MTKQTPLQHTQVLLREWRSGNVEARDELFERLYSELRQVSAALLRREKNVSIYAEDLVNEAAVRLIQLEHIEWADRAHFLALSARAMRRILIDHARKNQADKRAHQKVTLVSRHEAGARGLDLDHLDKALIRLSALDEEKAEIVELRYFGGLTLAEIAEVQNTSESTVKRHWRTARAFLLDALRDNHV